jgi:hypothetical protein
MAPRDTTGNSEEIKDSKARSLANLKPFKPGQSGNPSGRPHKKPVTEMYERIFADPIAMKALEKSIKKALSKGQMAMVLQLREMTDRVEGKIVQPIDAQVSMNLAEAIAASRQRAAKRGK